MDDFFFVLFSGELFGVTRASMVSDTDTPKSSAQLGLLSQKESFLLCECVEEAAKEAGKEDYFDGAYFPEVGGYECHDEQTDAYVELEVSCAECA